MDSSKRTLLALVLSLGVIVLWGYLFPPPPPTTTPGSVSEGEYGGSTQLPQPDPTPRPVVADATVGVEGSGARVEGEVATSIEVETDRYVITLSSLGGVVTAWQLKGYDEKTTLPGESSPPVDLLLPEAGSIQLLSVITGSSEVDALLASAVYQMEPTGRLRVGVGESAVVRLQWADGAGTSVSKELTFRGGGYEVEAVVDAVVPTRPPYLMLAGAAGGSQGPLSPGQYAGRAVVLAADKVTRHDPSGAPMKDIRKQSAKWPPEREDWLSLLDAAGAVERHGNVTWAGTERNYFAIIARGASPFPEVLALPSLVDVETAASMVVAIPVSAPLHMYLFGGPQDPEDLAAAAPELVRVIDYGFFAALAKLLFGALKFFYGYVHNWGVAVILLTIVIKTLFIPLNVKQLKMAQKMSKLSPRLKQLEAKYAKMRADPKQRMEAQRKMNEERMAIFQKEGVNPLAGCLPILLYLPFLWGFYQVLQVAIELRHAPFLLWIQDLSSKDPYYVTPVLMMLSMLIQQAITPSTADPTQRKIMLIMPIVFGWIFKEMAAGLVLFWLTQNVLSIAQQAWMNHRSEAPSPDSDAKSRRSAGRPSVEGEA